MNFLARPPRISSISVDRAPVYKMIFVTIRSLGKFFVFFFMDFDILPGKRNEITYVREKCPKEENADESEKFIVRRQITKGVFSCLSLVSETIPSEGKIFKLPQFKFFLHFSLVGSFLNFPRIKDIMPRCGVVKLCRSAGMFFF